MQLLSDDVHYSHGGSVHGAHQGMQPYVNVCGYHDTPFTHDFKGIFGIDIGVDQDFTGLFQPRAGVSHVHGEQACDVSGDDCHAPEQQRWRRLEQGSMALLGRTWKQKATVRRG